MFGFRKALVGCVAASACLIRPTASSAQTPVAGQPAAQTTEADEIVVTARRSGVPVWKVTGPKSTIILVGAIEEVSKETRWDPANLTNSLLKADRVMFPQAQEYTASPFAMAGFAIRLLRMAKMPKGQSVAHMMRGDQYQRLVALQRKGVLKPGFERTHPLMLAITLQDYADGKAGTGTDAAEYVRRAVKKHKVKLVPIPKQKVKKTINAVFASPPEAHIPCLLASVSAAEAGPGAAKARSDAWAQRRVPDVISSPVEKALKTCSLAEYEQSVPDWRGTLRKILAEPQLTLAVLDLASLADPGGTLDQLAAAGYRIEGPAWK